MKRRLSFTALLFVISCFRLFAQEPVVTILPHEPKVGDSITIIYNPVAPTAIFKAVRELNVEVSSVFLDEGPAVGERPMRFDGKLWLTGFRLRDSACLLRFRFVSDNLTDDNDRHPWDVLVHDKDGTPVRFAHYVRAASYRNDSSKEDH
jgi:hypothetical protein